MQRFSKDIIGIVHRLLRSLSMKRCNHNYKNIIGLSNINDAIQINSIYVNFRCLSDRTITDRSIFNWVHWKYIGHKVPIKY